MGEAIRSFTVHEARAGVSFLGRHRLVVAVENLTDVPYSGALNTGFFRPEPGRTLFVSWGVRF